ncbi:MAG: response regulator [Anaerolineae bacterium]|nr:response regulator [Anaerolineae bacterium]
MANILVIDDDKSILRLLEFTIRRAGHNMIPCTDSVQGLAQAEAQKPDLIVADVMMPNMTGYEFCRQARSKSSLEDTPIIIFSARFQPVDKQTALEAGATDYLPKTTSPDQLIRRINELVAHTAKPAATRGVVGLFSLRGGSGVTSLAVNIAIVLARGHGKPTALVDLARLGGHAALMLGVRPTSNIAQALASTQAELTPEVIKPYLMSHNSGVYLLASSHVYGQELLLTDGRLAQLVAILKAGFAFTVLDTPCFWEPDFAPTLQQFDKIGLVLTPDMPSIQSTVIALRSLAQLGVTEDKIALVVNQIMPQGALPLETIQKAIKRPLAASIPYDPDMVKAINSGQPLVLSNPDSGGATAIAGLANTLLS